MTAKATIPADLYFRELELWAREKESRRHIADHLRQGKVLDLAAARRRLRPASGR